jgi:hypothetical protein
MISHQGFFRPIIKSPYCAVENCITLTHHSKIFNNTRWLSHSNFQRIGIITLEIPDIAKLVAWHAEYKKHDIQVECNLIIKRICDICQNVRSNR